METIKEIQKKVIDRLAELNLVKEPKGLYEPIVYELQVGGKRLRPTLALYACQAFSGSYEHAFSPALALEVFHNFTLMHDDVMDNADKRRNKPTVHKVWNVNTAILSGDTMMAKAYEMLSQTDDKTFCRIFKPFSDTVLGVMEGQQYDMDFETRDDVTIPEYIEMIRLKTAVLIAGSLKIGALCGGASDADADAVYKFGIGVGLSFQICDDLLDVYGDTATFGKNIGGDIACNKKTYLYLKSLELAAGTSAESELKHWFSSTDFDKTEKFNAVVALYNQLGVRQQAEAIMDEQYEEAKRYLLSSSMPQAQKDELVTFAASLLHRNY